MMNQLSLLFLLIIKLKRTLSHSNTDESTRIEVIDLSRPTTWNQMSVYFGAMDKEWKICSSCGAPSLGTTLHLEQPGVAGSVHPAVIPTDYLLTRLQIVDVSNLATLNPTLVLSPEVALQWPALKRDAAEPTLLIFHFGWKDEDNQKIDIRTCSCKMPGLSYELAEWIVANLSHVVGVGSDTPSLESDQTREFSTRTVSHILGNSGVYMIENVNMKRKIPETGCLTLAMPLKLLNSNYVPTRLTAFCPLADEDVHVIMTVRHNMFTSQTLNMRMYDVNLDEILS